MVRPRKLPKVLNQDEQKALLKQCNKRYKSPLRNLCMLRLMLEAGLRAGEVVALKPSHLNMTTCKLMIWEGKGAKDRTLWINDDLRDLIGAWLEMRFATKEDWLFPTRTGGQILTNYLREMVKRYAQKAGLPEWEKVSPHTLRHSFGTDLYRETKNIRLVQNALGHTDLSTTMIYTHIHDEELEGAMRGFKREEEETVYFSGLLEATPENLKHAGMYIDLKAAAAVLDTDLKTVQKMRVKGELGHSTKISNRWRVETEAVKKRLKQQDDEKN